MTVVTSGAGYQETLKRLIGAIERRGLTVFARVDHAAGARAVGLELPPEEVVMFGSPRAGTPLMQADPRVGVELPLRMLVWEDAEGTRVGHLDPRELAEGYDVQAEHATLESMAGLLAALAAEAAG